MSVKITVVTPSYNQAKFLEETLRSVLCQRDQVHEYFVVDGGSTDGSVDLIRRYAHMIDWWVSEKDRGQSDAIQKGFSRATGDVICWLNSDDVFLPGALQKVRDAFARHPDWDVITAYHAHVNNETRIMALYRKPQETLLKMRWGVIRVCQQTCFFKRELYERVGGLDLSLHYVMDHDLWLKMFAAKANWGHLPEYLAGYRWHAEAKGMAHQPKFAEERKLLDQRYPQFSPPPWRCHAGQIAFRLSQILNGQHLLALLQTRRTRGNRLVDVFGDWIVPTPTAGERAQ